MRDRSRAGERCGRSDGSAAATGQVEDERQVAIRAAHALAASRHSTKVAAPRRFMSRIACSVPRRRPANAWARRREKTDRFPPASSVAQVHDLDGRLHCPTRRSTQPGRARPCRRVHAAIAHRRPGSRSPSTSRAPVSRGAPTRNPTSVVARGVRSGLVRAVMGLVHHDQAQVGGRREGGPSWSHHDPRVAAQDPPPRVAAPPGRHAGVQHRQVVADQRGDAIGQLGHQRDPSGTTNDGAPPFLDGRCPWQPGRDPSCRQRRHPPGAALRPPQGPPIRLEGGPLFARQEVLPAAARCAPGARAGHAPPFATPARQRHGPTRRVGGGQRRARSTPIAVARPRHAPYRLVGQGIQLSARCRGAARGGATCSSSRRSTRTRRARSSGGRSDQAACNAPERRSRSAGARQRAPKARRSDASAISSRSANARRSGSGRAAGSGAFQRRSSRDSSPGGSIAATAVPRELGSSGDLLRHCQQIRRQHRRRDDRLDRPQLDPRLRIG